MLKEALIEIFERDLKKLITEIGLYKDEKDLWIVKGEISNSAGNLCLHLIGNLNHFIGATLGNSGYVRHRDAEFNLKNILRRQLITDVEHCSAIVKETLNKLPEEDLKKNFPLEPFGKIVNNTEMLLHLYGHLTYHLGQINYHRRLV